jgi:hypothetical protein
MLLSSQLAEALDFYAALDDGSDQGMIGQVKAEFETARKGCYDAFEVWRLDRCLYRSPPTPEKR